MCQQSEWPLPYNYQVLCCHVSIINFCPHESSAPNLTSVVLDNQLQINLSRSLLGIQPFSRNQTKLPVIIFTVLKAIGLFPDEKITTEFSHARLKHQILEAK